MSVPSLARVLVARRLRPSPTAIALTLVCAAAAAAFGRHLAIRGLGPELELMTMLQASGSIGDLFLWQAGRAVALPFVVAAAFLVLDPVGEDEAQGWLAPLAAGGASRGEYLLVVTASGALAAGVAYLLAALAFAGGVATVSPAGGRTALRAAVGVPPLLVSAAAYGAACVALTRNRARALSLALGGVLVPMIVAVSWQPVAGAPPSRAAIRAISLHVPPFSWSAEPSVMLQHALYATVVLAIAARLARARLGRTP